MRALFLVVLMAAFGSLAAPSNKACLTCHTTPLFDGEAFSRSVHASLSCSDCHKGFDFSPHRAKPPEPQPAVAAQIAKLATKSPSPAALVACGNCHASQRDDLLASVHGRWLSEDRPASGPTCSDCHGAVHAIPKPVPGVALQSKKAIAARCAGCHEDAKFTALARLTTHASFADTIHGRLLKLGNERAPVCSSCHGAHDIVPMASPASTVVGANKTAICAECHKGGNANFAETFTHVPPNRVTRKVPYYTAMFFAFMASMVLTGLVIHLSLDAGSEFRLRWRRRKGKLPGETPAPKGYVERFDKHQLVQHWLMMIATFALLLSGWPLRAAAFGTSGTLAKIMGGAHGASIVHRAAGALLGAVAVYHVIYLTVLLVRRQKIHSMLPGLKDVRDVFQNIGFYLGLRKERPRFGHFMYIEKFEYLALTWGTIIIFSTGLVRWFPAWFARWMPARVIEFCQVAHGYEAMLAALVLLVWHLYNVHLKASIFPMSWVWIDGKIDLEALKEEHRAEYDELVAQGKVPGEKP
jgi:predicted CXXCH cytochrome family protein